MKSLTQALERLRLARAKLSAFKRAYDAYNRGGPDSRGALRVWNGNNWLDLDLPQAVVGRILQGGIEEHAKAVDPLEAVLGDLEEQCAERLTALDAGKREGL